ncbi:MAG: spiro-SPASM protein [Treponema sp.]|jgi:spiro-SPASM protein|nr:spiro-SPASM protein [Treponema sp.]
MRVLAVLYGGNLRPEAFQGVFPGGKSAFDLALERVRLFPGWQKTVILGGDFPGLEFPPHTELVQRPRWTRRDLLEAVSRLSQGWDLSCFAWADCPFLDPELTGAMMVRHLRYGAEYSYADGWPYGFAPELLAPGTAGILAKIEGDGEHPVERDSIFAVIQKDINSFDIETEISAVDLRSHRLALCADSKRNLLLLTRFSAAAGTGEGIPGAGEAEGIIGERPEILRTLPNFYPIQAARPCPQSCAFCPYPALAGPPAASAAGEEFLDPGKFEALLDRITAFSGDAVIDLSLWGELALHPRRMELIRAVLERPQLALVIETSGIGWKDSDLEEAAALAAGARPALRNPLPPLSWIVSLDTADGGRYREIRGPGFAEASGCARKLLALFPADAYVQAVRTSGAEDDIEKFYRSWKEAAPGGNSNIIIQKYDDFCGVLEKKQASDIAPIERQCCWHIMRDLPVLLDGTVPLCREELSALSGGGRVLGNIYQDSLETIWSAGEKYYAEHCVWQAKAAGKTRFAGQPGIEEQGGSDGAEGPAYPGICAKCDEYYTYNF